jgi:hypothetical protein
MARFRCRDCNSEGTFDYAGILACPRCASTNVQLALSITDLPDDDPLFAAIEKLAEMTDEDDEDDRI